MCYCSRTYFTGNQTGKGRQAEEVEEVEEGNDDSPFHGSVRYQTGILLAALDAFRVLI